MNSQQIANVIKNVTLLLGEDLEEALYQGLSATQREYSVDEVYEFKRDLIEEANTVKLVLLDQPVAPEDLESFLQSVEIPLIAFRYTGDGFAPVVISKGKKSSYLVTQFGDYDSEEVTFEELDGALIRNEDGELLLMGAFSYRSLVSDHEENDVPKKLTPIARLIRLLGAEKKDIFYVFVYAAFVGIVSLTLPLGIQATVELISGGVVFSSIYLLITLVLVGVLAAGGLQIMQITIVEYLQRRVFTKAALEFTFRIPRMKAEALQNLYVPELINRFFDVLTIQKGLPKLLGDLTSGIIQILFGLLLLSFYHPFFVFFGLVLVLTLVLIFRLTGPKGLKSSIKESKFKYKVVYWLEELARTLNSFKISGNSSLPLRKTEYNVNNYLINRKVHFKVLVSQYFYIILFKAAITGGLLIIGTSLVVGREITLGQFVASEVIIILILNSVEKIITYMDVVYDMLTAVDKISQVTDLPLEKAGGIDLTDDAVEKGFSLEVKNLSYAYPGDKKKVLNDINLSMNCGDKICIVGGNDAGKTTLTRIISGLLQGYDGMMSINGYSIRDLDLTNLRDRVAKNISQEDLFEGTILDNITVGKPSVTTKEAAEALQSVGLADQVNMLPDGMQSEIIGGGKGYSSSFINKLILARCLVKKPRLMVLNDFFTMFERSEKERLIELVIDKSPCSLVAVSNDPQVMAAVGRVVILENGRIKAEGSYEELLKEGLLNNLIKV
jgi:ABC-type bacteriocin/lantibiotic exporter with double-glycine peptidase domain